MSEFCVGQRWLSETETELGLGIVQDVAHRLVTLYFPACDEARTYARDNAPVTRIQFKPGDGITTAAGEFWFVVDTETVDDIVYYLAHAEGNPDQQKRIAESQLSHQLHLSHALDRLLSKQLDSPRWFELRCAALDALSGTQRSPVLGLAGARTSLIPHQLFIANEVAGRFAPRVLLADEVGLGKTIEAGLIIHQQLLTHRAQRVLVVVPEQLVHQWFVEMIRRFNLHFSIFDQARVEAIGSTHTMAMSDEFDGEAVEPNYEEILNPFLSEQLVLCSTRFLTACDIDALQNGEWDLLVLDEAHHLRWSDTDPSIEYQRVETLARMIPGLLLLTATPQQLGIESHFSRLHLLDPRRFPALDQFLHEQTQHQSLASLLGRLVDAEQWDEPLKEEIAGLLPDIATEESHRDAIVRELIDRHGTGRVLFRNTRESVAGFPDRQVHGHALEIPEFALPEIDGDPETPLTTLLQPETRFNDDNWCRADTRVQWLQEFLKQHRQDKVLLICASRTTAIDLEAYLRFRCGVEVSVFHEDMDIISRDRAAAYFADDEQGAQALICSEIGSEGRNFQFSHLLVLFDLPLNPDLLEQRIGRLDRIGQTHDIEIHVPYYQDHAQEVLFRWYHEGCNAFASSNAAGGMIFSQCQEQLEQALRDLHDVDALLSQTRTIADATKLQLETGRDRLLELSSSNAPRAQALVGAIEEQEQRSPQAFMEAAFDRYGVNMEFHSEGCFVISPGDHMFDHFPHLPDEGLTATFRRDIALQRDDIRFLTWEHPMVISVIELVLVQEKGSACITTIRTEGVKPGTVLLEAVYGLQAIAPRLLQVQRFLPVTTIRTLTDLQGRDIAKGVPHHRLNRLTKKLDKTVGRQVIDRLEDELREMSKHSQQLAHERARPMIDDALANMHAEQERETNRLISLQAKNPAIRDEEIDFLRYQTQELDKYIRESQAQLEGLRVIVAT